MSNSANHGDKHSALDVDISTSVSAWDLGWIRYFLPRLAIIFLPFVVVSLVPSYGVTILQAIAAVVVLGLVGWIAWSVLVKHGMFTWMRLASQPAQLIARGQAAAAEAAYAKALTRANRFAPEDRRRGLMLGVLAMFAKNQGRYPESLALYEESAEILARQLDKQLLDYFTVLINYGLCFINLKDYAAAQRILEKAFDLTFMARKRAATKWWQMQLREVQMIQFVLHMSLAFLMVEMGNLAEAALQLRDADFLIPMLPKQFWAQWQNHYVVERAMWQFESGHIAEAANLVAEAPNPNYSECLGVRAKLHLFRLEYTQAEQLLRQYQDEARTVGTLHRPELLKPTLDFAESLFGQGKHDDAIASLQAARSIVADFTLPADAAWRKALETWLQRARDLDRVELLASLEDELGKASASPQQAITVLEKFRIHSQAAK